MGASGSFWKDGSTVSDAIVRAVVIGGELNALGIVRSLGRAGVPVILIAASDKGPAMASRYVERRVVAPVQGPELIRTIVELSRGERAMPVLFATEEKTVHTISAHRDQLSGSCRIRLPEHDILMALMHKRGFQDLAERHGALLPRCVNVRSRHDLPLIERLRFPCVFKPSEKNYEYGARFKKGYVVSTPEQVAQLYQQIEQIQADMVVQEWIEGSDSDVYFCLQYVGADGSPVASFAGRKIRSWPPRVGGTASCTAAWEDETELTRMTQEFFARVGFVGMGAMEYKRDRRDGRFYMVEPTVARTDFQEEVATLHGINIPLAAYHYELGRDIRRALQPIAPRRIVWREREADRMSIAQQGSERDFARLPTQGAYWRLSDPGPWLDWACNWVKARTRGLCRRLLRAA